MSLKIESNKIHAIGNVLNDKNRPLKERFRALFTLRNIGGDDSIECIKRCFNDDSALLKHELAYCLGQMQNPKAIPILIEVLEDKNQEPMVRHEAAEALGAIGDSQVIPILEKYKSDEAVEVAETCEIALERINWLLNSKNEGKCNDGNLFHSIDPTPSITDTNNDDINDVNKLKETLLNENETLFNRYKAMFTLRNICTNDSVLALAEGLNCKKSALFRHEIAFVLGQLQNPCSIKSLIKNLCNEYENEMVRHECAEALGSIATDECYKILNEYLNDSKRVVKESCEIALDMCDYENSPEFQYADTLNKINADN